MNNVTAVENRLPIDDGFIYTKTFAPNTNADTAVILSHGFNSSHDKLADVAAAFANCGVYAVCYDFRGGSLFSKSSGKSKDMSVATELQDLMKVSESLEEKGFKRIVLYGESQGGFVSALAAANAPKMFCTLLLLYPAFCIPDDWQGKHLDSCTQVMGMEISQKYIDDLPQYDVFERMKNFSGRVLIAHGTADSVVDISYSKKLTKYFKNASLIKCLGEGHGFSPQSREKWVKECTQFVLKS